MESREKNLENTNVEAIIEAILYAMGDPVEIGKLVHALEIEPKEIKKAIENKNERNFK